MLNSDKTKFLITCKPNMRNSTVNVRLNTTSYVIEQSNKNKILGIFITSCLCNNVFITLIVSQVSYRLIILKKVTKYTNFRTTKTLFDSVIVRVFKYACPLLINTKIQPLKKLNTLLMKCTCLIMNTIGWVTIHQLIIIKSILFIHKCIYENCLSTIMELVTFSINRDINKPMVRQEPPLIKVKQSLINKSIFLYISLPEELRTFNKKNLQNILAVMSWLFLHQCNS